ncbi:MAG: preprotein translocase subunit SecE [Erysipelotrichaceae bacterium]|nr:preprotein translocase subunit SecE [Erysipelotrichaceae bacterium]
MAKENRQMDTEKGNLFQELAKVRWPSFKELMSTSFLVIAFTVLFGLYFFLCELLATGLITRIVGA